MLDLTKTSAPTVDPGLPEALAARARTLARTTTLAGFLRYRRAKLGLSLRHIAEAAILPAPILISWDAGAPAAVSQLIRCAPVLQLPEEVLLAAWQGLRDISYWPLPTPPDATLERR